MLNYLKCNEIMIFCESGYSFHGDETNLHSEQCKGLKKLQALYYNFNHSTYQYMFGEKISVIQLHLPVKYKDVSKYFVQIVSKASVRINPCDNKHFLTFRAISRERTALGGTVHLEKQEWTSKETFSQWFDLLSLVFFIYYTFMMCGNSELLHIVNNQFQNCIYYSLSNTIYCY